MAALAVLAIPASAYGVERYAKVDAEASPPKGWIEFCVRHKATHDCDTPRQKPRDVVLDKRAWKDLTAVNKLVNTSVRPMTDFEHWGVTEKWEYPADGYGDCEDYVLQKRKMLLKAKWPRSALLITVVLDKQGGHAVLTVKTDKGEFVLDNQRDEVLLWSETGYRFVKRQSQADQNAWLSISDDIPVGSITTRLNVP